MDLFDIIEQTRFLGREFLVWLWWRSELLDGEADLPEHGACEVWIDDQITLEAQGEQVERSALRGASPALSPEAKEALRQGKVPIKARISIAKDERDFGFVLNTDSFALSSVKMPTLLQDEPEERFYERMYLLEELDSMISAVYGEFLLVRVSAAWEKEIAPAIRAWVREEDGMDRERYLAVVKKVRAATPNQAN